jgi:hypothetical protein
VISSELNYTLATQGVDANDWISKLYITSLAITITVNALVTGLIVFRIFKATEFLGIIKPTSVERTLGSTGGNKYRHIIFVIIESAMALLAIQLIRVLLGYIPAPDGQLRIISGFEGIVIVIHQMLNVIIIKSVHSYFFCFTEIIYLARASHQQ